MAGTNLSQHTQNAFNYLLSEFGFESIPVSTPGDLAKYSSTDFVFDLGYHPREGFWFFIRVKSNSFWIHDHLGRDLELIELLRIWNPSEHPPNCEPPETITWFANRLREYGPSMLRGDLSVCEDALILKRSSLIRGVSLNAYIRLLREASHGFPAGEREELESVFLTQGAVAIWLRIQRMGYDGKLKSEKFWQIANQMAHECCS